MHHPYVLLTAFIVTAPLIAPLGRLFFGTWTQFADDAGLRPLPESARWSELRTTVGSHFGSLLSTVLLDLLGFLVAYAALLATAYHTLAWVLAFFA